MPFIDTVSKLLSDNNLSKNKMLKDLGMGAGTFATWQKRGTVPNGETLAKIADYFGVSTDYLLGKQAHNIQIRDEDDNVIVLDDETLDYIDSLRARPEMKMLFSVSKKATKEDIIKTVKIIEALRDESERR